MNAPIFSQRMGSMCGWGLGQGRAPSPSQMTQAFPHLWALQDPPLPTGSPLLTSPECLCGGKGGGAGRRVSRLDGSQSPSKGRGEASERKPGFRNLEPLRGREGRDHTCPSSAGHPFPAPTPEGQVCETRHKGSPPKWTHTENAHESALQTAMLPGRARDGYGGPAHSAGAHPGPSASPDAILGAGHAWGAKRWTGIISAGGKGRSSRSCHTCAGSAWPSTPQPGGPPVTVLL